MESFTSNGGLGLTPRRDFEDAVEFHGISAFTPLILARDKADPINRALARNGKPTWTHDAGFEIDGELRHPIASVEPPIGHYTVWGEPADFASSVFALDPI